MSTVDTTITNLSVRQQMLCFAYLAYTGERITTPNPEAIILSNINAALQSIGSPVDLSTWSVVWGPIAFTVPGAKYQDNMVYVLQNGSSADYAIAVRGTNFVSQVDWFLEDFEVIDTMPWPVPGAVSKCQAGAAISESTSIDLQVLLGPNMTDPVHGQLLSFLAERAPQGKPINLCVTGHSLGGVLASTLALYLLENQSAWDASGASTVSCVSFAAPTAGNALFAANAGAVFQQAAAAGSFPGWDTSLASNLDNVACSLDAAPLFSAGQNIASGGLAGPLFALYATPNNSVDVIDFGNLSATAAEEWKYFQPLVLQPLASMLSPQGYTQLPSETFAGSFIGSSLSFESLVSGLADYLEAFAAQAGYQHSSSYPVYLGLTQLMDPSIVVRGGSDAPAAPPQISDISPTSAYRGNPAGVTVQILGSGFASGLYSNHLVFSGGTTPIPYRITAATPNQLTAVFYVDQASAGVQSLQVVTSSPFYTSNAVDFEVRFL
ncbi:hypothetical protein RQP53_02900 [Paucibacter sp. APW11]|uniref:Fungal lipase-type domain-containing protein n=1 Tax=Roseateles aquae TaxID=3077235 RepID=A0ABU3P6M7_9BURK|nr:hypothetical protein [Paucibacter sp. APW11]MDT8998219.1 hypothetical protein [Paucibacter sp. APW11]